MAYAVRLRSGDDVVSQFPHLFIVDGNGTIKNDFGGRGSSELTVASISAEIDKLTK